jgi:hypothetical protein
MEASSAWPFAGAWRRTGRCRSGDVAQTWRGHGRGEERGQVETGMAGRLCGDDEGVKGGKHVNCLRQ